MQLYLNDVVSKLADVVQCGWFEKTVTNHYLDIEKEKLPYSIYIPKFFLYVFGVKPAFSLKLLLKADS